MAALPTGTVTLLFTDIEGSTRLLQQQGTIGIRPPGAAHTGPEPIQRRAAARVASPGTPRERRRLHGTPAWPHVPSPRVHAGGSDGLR